MYNGKDNIRKESQRETPELLSAIPQANVNTESHKIDIIIR
jgi:hypothetical protein